MKGLKRESNIHLRISEQEKVKYSKVADEIGLSPISIFKILCC